MTTPPDRPAPGSCGCYIPYEGDSDACRYPETVEALGKIAAMGCDSMECSDGHPDCPACIALAAIAGGEREK